MNYISSPVGNEISSVMWVDKNVVINNKLLKKILLEALKKDKFNILGEISHEFKPQGYSLVILIAESHASIHTYPEYNSLVFNLYSCRGPKDGRKTYEYLKEKLKPHKFTFEERPIIVKENFNPS